MKNPKSLRIGYVVKRYPRYSETFIVNEILAHEAQGLDIEIFALRPPADTHFQDTIAQVAAPVNYLPFNISHPSEGMDFWSIAEQARMVLPNLWPKLEAARGELPITVYQALFLAAQVRLKNIRHLHAHFASSPTSVVRLAAHFSGITFSFTAHAKDIFHESVKPEHFRRKLAGAEFAVTISDFNLRYLRQKYGTVAKKVTRIYNGLDLKRFSYEPPRRGHRLIIGAGRLVEKKGFQYLVEACALLAQQGEDVECFIIGTGLLESELEGLIAKRGLRSKVKLLGPQPQREIIRCMRDAAIFVAPCVVGEDSNQDGLPMVILEAMALGIPCISTDVSGIPEVVHDGVTGLLVHPRDVGALAAAIKLLFNDFDLRKRLSRQARKLIEEKFDLYRNAGRLQQLFRTRIKGDRKPLGRKD